MLDVGWQELFLIAVVALVVVGPKDLPGALRGIARALNKARGLSREFQSGLAELVREAELDELKRKVESAAHTDVRQAAKDAVDPTGTLAADFDPAEFARELKADVEGRPPMRPRAGTGVAPEAIADSAQPRGTPATPAGVPAESQEPAGNGAGRP